MNHRQNNHPSTVELNLTDAMELAETLSLIRDWLTTDTGHINDSLHRFIGTHGYPITDLANDLSRHVFLLGGDDGEHLFTDTPN